MEEGHACLLSMTFDGYMTGFEESASGVELANDVASYMGVNTGLTISRCIRCPPILRVWHLLYLRHRKYRPMVVGLDIASVLSEVRGLDSSSLYPVGEAFGMLRLTLGEVMIVGGVSCL